MYLLCTWNGSTWKSHKAYNEHLLSHHLGFRRTNCTANVVLVTKIAFFSGLYQLSVSVNVCVCALFMCTTVLCPSFFLCRGRLKIVLLACRATAQSSPTPYCLTNQQVCHLRPEWLHENRCVCVMCGGASMYMHAFALDFYITYLILLYVAQGHSAMHSS